MKQNKIFRVGSLPNTPPLPCDYIALFLKVKRTLTLEISKGEKLFIPEFRMAICQRSF